jgi:hypothetical protein
MSPWSDVNTTRVFWERPRSAQQPSAAELELLQNAARIDIENATITAVIKLLGEPQEYLWGNQKFTKDKLPHTYIARYPGGLMAVVTGESLVELRFDQPGYRFMNAIEVGWPLFHAATVVPSRGTPCPRNLA